MCIICYLVEKMFIITKALWKFFFFEKQNIADQELPFNLNLILLGYTDKGNCLFKVTLLGD